MPSARLWQFVKPKCRHAYALHVNGVIFINYLTSIDYVERLRPADDACFAEAGRSAAANQAITGQNNKQINRFAVHYIVNSAPNHRKLLAKQQTETKGNL